MTPMNGTRARLKAGCKAVRGATITKLAIARSREQMEKAPKIRNPYVEAAITKKGGPMRNRKEKRAKARLRKRLEQEWA